MKLLKKNCLVSFVLFLFFGLFTVIPVKANDYTDHFTGEGVPIYYSNIAYTWGGWTYETVTEEAVGYNENTDTVIYRYRYYLVQWGPAGSKTRQTAPVQVFMDGVYKGKFDIMYIGYFSNRCQFGGQIDVEGKVGSFHHITIKDDPNYTGNWTTVNWEGDRPFILPSFTVNFKDYNDSLIKREVVKKYHDATPPADPLRLGYIFTGWKGDYKRVTSNRDIYAQYKYNNPPTISAEDRYFYADEDVTDARLLEKVKANDAEDGNIKNRVKIIENNVVSGKIGTYKVTYQVTDTSGLSATTSCNIYIVDNNADDKTVKYVRSINLKYIDTLKPLSKWRTNPILWNELNDMLRRQENPTDENSIQIWEFSPDDIKEVKKHVKKYGFTKESTELFLQKFSGNRKK